MPDRRRGVRSRLGRRSRTALLAAVSLLAAGGGSALLMPGLAGAQLAEGDGSFSPPFLEPTVGPGYGYPRARTASQDPARPDARCIERNQENPTNPNPGPTGPQNTRGFIDCKPAAGALNLMPNGRALYWDNLAGTENVEFSIGSEFGVVGLNDQSRVLDFDRRRWNEPTPVDGGAKSRAPIESTVPGRSIDGRELFRTSEDPNDGSLFCADNNFLEDGRLLATGGTKYTNDPGNDQSKYGSTELYGIENTRIYNQKTNRWTQAASMNRPRWYPTSTTLGDGRQFVVSGVRKLVKPVNQSGQIDAQEQDSGFGVQEGQNERNTEFFDPDTRSRDAATGQMREGRWTIARDRFDDGRNRARRSLPLFARMHLLPNGHPYYNAAGQSFAPEGQAFDEATWNIAASFNPKTRSWSELGIPGVGAVPVPGFRGSTFSVMMPLRPDRDGEYKKADFLTAGGVLNPPSPGGYFAVRDSFFTTVETDGDKVKPVTSRATGPLAATSSPAFGRWYSQGTLLPTGEVLATSGADRDEVVGPGFEIPVRQAELFNPETNTWRRVATAKQDRGYHNTAVLLRDGRVLVGGHAVISNGYLSNRTVAPGVTAQQDTGRDPSFEIFSPPYLKCPGRQAKIRSTKRAGNRLRIELDASAGGVKSVVAVRNGSTTHIVDADQRNVELEILSRRGNTVTVRQAPNGNVMPPGPYMLFVNRSAGGCAKPSVAKQVSVAGGKIRARAAQRREPRFTG